MMIQFATAGSAFAAIVIAMVIVMTLAWAAQRQTGNSGWIDTIWSLGVGAVAMIAILWSQPANFLRAAMVAGVTAFWSIRLGSHILRRTLRGGDDPRYAALMREWGADAPKKLFLFLQAQAVAGAALVGAALLAASNPAPQLGMLDALALAVAIIALAGEALADGQLRQHIATAAAKNTICETGLWRWSRHPNYFFEFLFWVAMPLFALSGAVSNLLPWLAWAAPAMMYWLLRHVSGVPPLEAHMLRSRGAAFSDYQRRVSAFFPRPPRP